MFHAGGANTTADRVRLAVNPNYHVAYLRQQENQYLAVPRAAAAAMPEALQKVLGYNGDWGLDFYATQALLHRRMTAHQLTEAPTAILFSGRAWSSSSSERRSFVPLMFHAPGSTAPRARIAAWCTCKLS